MILYLWLIKIKRLLKIMNSPVEQPNITEAEHDSLVSGEELHPQIQFIYGSHATEEDAQRLVEQLQPYNVIAMELVADPTQRQAAQTFANQVTHAKSSEEVADQVEMIAETLSPSDRLGLSFRALSALKNFVNKLAF